MLEEIIQELYGSNSKYFIVMDVLHNPRIAGTFWTKQKLNVLNASNASGASRHSAVQWPAPACE